ncbi:hypothetical protein Pcinc_014011 [Petrolisthes cinctipes]|uniref:Uncharacterized protein n=1 Tax=Petrolisthes cinctipes TaxID=88211 RepID=A0AAE1FXC1_PETCI|nr:hypothetical protein Pcinc_014011 [Petrolisthes cinctipes]
MPTVGALTFIFIGVILFAMVLFVTCFKRQVGRIKERSRRDPHVPGSEAKKTLRREIERRLTRVAEVCYEARLVSGEGDNTAPTPPYFYRMKALDNMKYLEQELCRLEGVNRRGGHESIRAFLVNLTGPGGVLVGVEQRVIHELCDYYDHARFHPHRFTPGHFTPYHTLLVRVLHCGRVGDKCGGRSVGSGGGGGKAPSDHDSAIDEPDPLSLDDDSLVVTEAALTLLHRPTPALSSDHNFETPV